VTEAVLVVVLKIVRASGITLRTPDLRETTPLNFQPRVSSQHLKHVKMDDSILSSPTVRKHKPGIEWRTPERSVIHAMKRSGKSYG
jgi:hypothetical protein